MDEPRRALEAVAELAQALAAAWPMFESTSADLAASAYPSYGSGGSGGRRGTAVPDPVHGAVLSRQRYQETNAEVDQVLRMLQRISTRMSRLREEHPAIAQEVEAALEAARCDRTVDPSCTNLAVSGGRCHKCSKRLRRQVVGS